MRSTTKPKRTCRHSGVARRFCDCLVPECADCCKRSDETELVWDGAIEDRDRWVCRDCASDREDEAAIESAIESKEAAE